MKSVRLLLLPLLLMFALTGAANPVTVSLSVEPESNLPGLYRFWRVQLKNTSTDRVTVSNKMALRVYPESGAPVVVIRSFGPIPHSDGLPLVAPIELAPGGSHDLTFTPVERLLKDATLPLQPGRYRIQLLIDEALDPDSSSGSTKPDELVDPVASKAIDYEVTTPTGPDQAVWNLLKDVDPVRWYGFAERIWRDYPESRYALEHVPSMKGRGPSLYETALRRNPPPDLAHGYRLILAQYEMDRGFALIETDLEAAVAAYDRGRKHLEEVLRHARIPEQIASAREALRGAYDREAIVRINKAARGIVEPRFVAYAECAEKLPDNNYRVHFSYFVDGTGSFSFPLGNENKFTPTPFERGQPTTFAPGIASMNFNIVTSEPELTWHIGKHNIVVKPRELRACREDELPKPPPDDED